MMDWLLQLLAESDGWHYHHIFFFFFFFSLQSLKTNQHFVIDWLIVMVSSWGFGSVTKRHCLPTLFSMIVRRDNQNVPSNVDKFEIIILPFFCLWFFIVCLLNTQHWQIRPTIGTIKDRCIQKLNGVVFFFFKEKITKRKNFFFVGKWITFWQL